MPTLSPLLFCIPAAFCLMHFLTSDLYVAACRPLQSETRRLLLIVFACVWLGLLTGSIQGISIGASSLFASR